MTLTPYYWEEPSLSVILRAKPEESMVRPFDRLRVDPELLSKDDKLTISRACRGIKNRSFGRLPADLRMTVIFRT